MAARALTAVDIVKAFVLESLAQRSGSKRPLVVGIQAPQGSGELGLTFTRILRIGAPLSSVTYPFLPGKSYITEHVQRLLVSEGIKVVSASLDDFYHTHANLVKLARENPENGLLHGRGLPGTHDIALAADCLTKLQNADASTSVEIPFFDKSLFNGEGDRSSSAVTVNGKVDVVILEGWMVGFTPLSDDQLTGRYQEAKSDPVEYAKRHLDYERPLFLAHSLSSLRAINGNLSHYSTSLWPHVSLVVRLRPKSMKYMPAYELFQDAFQARSSDTPGLQILLDEDRSVLETGIL
ncbi:hypothetical protein EMMF5_004495 [Cystobasidiomycetes sp. EMM_F5]